MTLTSTIFYFNIFVSFFSKEKVCGNINGLIPIIVDDCKDETQGCESLKAYCKDPNYISFLMINCKKTCGYCENSTLTADCEDRYPTGPNSCPSLKSLCKHPYYLSFLKENCPKTCEYCIPLDTTTDQPASSDCYDLAEKNGSDDCKRNPNLCETSFYRKLMYEQCKKTCGYCT
uniref:ShKT domain-containing protein n=1 Tax=Strongyloides papillosus TaxID=174720 RepID=A0A0N5B7A1_STREA